MRPRPTLFTVLIAILWLAFSVGTTPALADSWEPVGGPVNGEPTPVDVGPAFAEVAGTPDMAWEEIAGGHTSVHAASWNGASWTALGSSVSGSEHADSVSGPAIADVGGTPYVAWTADPAEDKILRSVYVSAWDGTGWTRVGGALNHDPAHSAYLPTLSVVGGVLYAAWLEDRDNGGNFGVTVSRLVGGAWQAVGTDPAELDPTRGSFSRPSIADVGGVPWVGYVEFQFVPEAGPQEYSHIRVERLDGNTWTPVGAGSISSPETDGGSVALGVVGGTPTIAWAESNSGLSPPIFDVRVAQWDGTAWTRLGGALNGTTPTHYAEPVSLAAIEGRPWVGYMEENGGDDAVVDQWTGTAWQPAAPPLHTSIAGNSTKLPVVAAIGGVPWVAWLDDDDEAAPNGHVYAATQAADTQPPVASATITGSGGHISGDTYGGSVTVAGTAVDPPPSSGTPTVRCALDPATPPTSYDDLGTASCSPVVTGLGPHTFYVAARDPAGNTSSVVSVSFTIIPVPDTIITSGPTGDTWTTVPNYTFTSTIPGSTFTCSVDGAPPTACTSPRGIGAFGAGSTHVFSVRATSPAGVADPTPAVAVVHVNATETVSRDCDLTPYPSFYPVAPPGSVLACDFRFGTPIACSAHFRCLTAPTSCPAAASCTVRVNANWVDGDEDVEWVVQAFADPDRGTFCDVPDDNRACATHDSEMYFGPASLEGLCTTSEDPTGSLGAAADRELRCTATMTISPAAPLGVIGIGGGIGIFAPGAGKLILGAGVGGNPLDSELGGAPGGSVRVAKKAAPVFKTTTIDVATAGAVRFVPKLSAAAKNSYDLHHRLPIAVRMTFVPADGGTTLTRTIKTTLKPTPKRPPRCPARLPKHLKRALVCRPK
jgi:hypothetical protein